VDVLSRLFSTGESMRRARGSNKSISEDQKAINKPSGLFLCLIKSPKVRGRGLTTPTVLVPAQFPRTLLLGNRVNRGKGSLLTLGVNPLPVLLTIDNFLSVGHGQRVTQC
jgi:hypothetical protein